MTDLAERVAELEAMVARLVDVQAGLVEAVDRLTPSASVIRPVSGDRPALRVVKGGAR